MKRFDRRAFALAVCALALTGCAATGTKYSDMAASIPAAKSSEGRIYFFRSSSFVGAAIQPDIKLNGQVVGTSKPGGFFYVDPAKATPCGYLPSQWSSRLTNTPVAAHAPTRERYPARNAETATPSHPQPGSWHHLPP